MGWWAADLDSNKGAKTNEGEIENINNNINGLNKNNSLVNDKNRNMFVIFNNPSLDTDTKNIKDDKQNNQSNLNAKDESQKNKDDLKKDDLAHNPNLIVDERLSQTNVAIRSQNPQGVSCNCQTYRDPKKCLCAKNLLRPYTSYSCSQVLLQR